MGFSSTVVLTDSESILMRRLKVPNSINATHNCTWVCTHTHINSQTHSSLSHRYAHWHVIKISGQGHYCSPTETDRWEQEINPCVWDSNGEGDHWAKKRQLNWPLKERESACNWIKKKEKKKNMQEGFCLTFIKWLLMIQKHISEIMNNNGCHFI